MRTREEQIQARRSQMPKKYRTVYDRAVRGKSLRSAINAQCLECCCWQSKEVSLCTDCGCPLWSVRPYQLPQNAREGDFSSAESTELKNKA